MTERFGELVAAAQVGTRKNAPSRATDFPLEGTERTLLLELGTLALMRRAGATGLAAQPLDPAPQETQRVADVADVLDEALDESLPAVLEWAREAAKRGFVAPPAAVARLVSLVNRHPEVLDVLGERGRWLAAIMGIDLRVEGESLPPVEEWDSLDPRARARLVERSPDDLELFEKALTDRRREVREPAAERLVRMSNSPQAQTLRGLAKAAIRIERALLKSRMVVDLPDPATLPKWLPRTTAQGYGQGALALFDLVAHVPPSLWGESPDRMLDLAKATEHATILNPAWQRAAVRFDDQTWIDALLPRMESPDGPLSSSAAVEQASDAAFDRYAQDLLRARSPDLVAFARLLVLRESPLSAATSRLFVEAVARHGQSAKPNDYYLGYVLPPLGTRLDPSVQPLVAAGLGDSLVRVQEGWLKLLRLRTRLLESLR